MANFKALLSKAKSRYQQWEANSKVREKRDLEKLQTRRAKEAIKHLYDMERAKRRLELAQLGARIRAEELKRKRDEAKIKGLRGKSFWGSLLSGESTTKRKTSRRKRQ